MTKSTDEQGRIYLPKAIRERFGDEYRIVEFPNHVALFPVDEDPLDGVQEAVDDAFAGENATTLKERGRVRIVDGARPEEERDDEVGPDRMGGEEYGDTEPRDG